MRHVDLTFMCRKRRDFDFNFVFNLDQTKNCVQVRSYILITGLSEENVVNIRVRGFHLVA